MPLQAKCAINRISVEKAINCNNTKSVSRIFSNIYFQHRIHETCISDILRLFPETNSHLYYRILIYEYEMVFIRGHRFNNWPWKSNQIILTFESSEAVLDLEFANCIGDRAQYTTIVQISKYITWFFIISNCKRKYRENKQKLRK